MTAHPPSPAPQPQRGWFENANANAPVPLTREAPLPEVGVGEAAVGRSTIQDSHEVSSTTQTKYTYYWDECLMNG